MVFPHVYKTAVQSARLLKQFFLQSLYNHPPGHAHTVNAVVQYELTVLIRKVPDSLFLLYQYAVRLSAC